MQLRAPFLYPMTGQVLKDCAVGIVDDRISYVVPIAVAPHDPEVIDLPHTTLLPGFVNAHCHLDLSHLRGQVSYTGSFTEWVQKIVTLRKHQGAIDIQAAAQELINSGVTTVMDHVGQDPAIADLLSNPLRKWMFLEVIGFTPVQAAAAFITQYDRSIVAQRQDVYAMPSPHAPYSLDPEAFSSIIESSAKNSKLLSIHCAEGTEEWEMFTEGKGKLWELVRMAAHVTPASDEAASWMPAQGRHDATNTPISYLSKNNLLPRTPWMAVHCNTLTDDDITSLKQSHATVVHCPRSHHFFNHPPFPMERLRAAGVPVAIGTDSLASCPNFDFLEELRALQTEFTFLTTAEIFQMAVHTNTIAPQNFADIIGLPQQNDLLSGPITFSMIGGRRVI